MEARHWANVQLFRSDQSEQAGHHSEPEARKREGDIHATREGG